MSDKGRGTRDEAEDRAAEAYTRTLKLLGCRPSEVISKRMAFRKGFWRGYEAAVAAERERIIAELEALLQIGRFEHDTDREFTLGDAIKIVKGGEDVATN